MPSFRLVVANLHNDPRAVEQILEHADYILANECRDKAWREIRSLPAEWSSWRPGGAGKQNPHIWRTDLVAKSSTASKQLMRGGRRGLSELRNPRRLVRRFRARRLGPSRAATARFNVLTEGGKIILVATHFPAKWKTDQRWRRFLVKRVVVPRLRRFVRVLERYHPGVPIIVAGDLNAPQLYDVNLGPGWNVVRTLPDFGPRRRYTQVHYFGDVEIDEVSELHTASDHDAPVMRVTVKETP